MKLHSILLWLLIGMLYGGIAQVNPVQITWGEKLPIPKSLQQNLVLSQQRYQSFKLPNSGYVTVFAHPDRKPGIVSLQVLDKGLGLKKEVLYEMGSKKENPMFMEAALMGEKLYLFFQHKGKSNVAYSQAFNPSSLTPIGERKVLGELKEGKGGQLIKGFNYSFSKDMKFFLLTDLNLLAFSAQALPNTLPVKVKVFDRNLDLVWQKEVSVPTTGGQQQISQFFVNDAETIYCLTSEIAIEFVEMAYSDISYNNIQLTVLADRGNKTKSYPLEFGKEVISALQGEVDPEGRFVIGGLYSNRSAAEADGSFISTWSVGAEKLSRPSLMPFEEKTMQALYGSRRGQTEAEIFAPQLGPIILGGDGSVYLITELTRPSGDLSTMGGVRFDYHYDLVVQKLDETGEVLWEQVIAKRQIFKNDATLYRGYFIFLTEDKMHLFFNDMKLSLYENPPPKVSTGSFPNLVLAKVSIDTQGKIQREGILTHPKKEGKVMVPAFCKQVSATEMLYFGGTGSYYYPALMKVK